ncbi:uncharacterized protein B0I36DRAFT_424735 [Microdochium trichocladiopsis]|uniref:3'-5' exonuclease domain-containing protein n=1 Tax=Microdochium trichocladiopsis TaxID=1682393 RepID=A0A9P9BM89_9PEZI|nr:uncharacterized protein B0I36DRAFT_424735 [Microdochium trichocladiopsis]KAH7025240.1 hypothetical protein B0I36DRAFT_424735 [Microdochium trichocladiopsis]
MKEIKTEIINTPKQIGDLVDWLVLRHAPPEPYEPTMNPTLRVYVIDVYSLGLQTFNTTGTKGRTLKDVLEDEKIPKILFDVRNDSDALFAHFGVALQGVQDLQLMESATRTTTSSRKYLHSLARCIEQHALHSEELTSWKRAKEKGRRLFRSEYGGSYEICVPASENAQCADYFFAH